MTTSPQQKQENKCPDCLTIDLEGALVQKGFLSKFLNTLKGFLSKFLNTLNRIFQPQPRPGVTKQINLYLSILFNEQKELLFGGYIKFGLKGGELRLRLDNGDMPLEARELGGLFELSIREERQKQKGSENQSNVEASWVKSEPGVKANRSEKRTAGTTDKFQFTVYQVTTKGSNIDPAWVFEVKTGEPVLKGLLKKAKLGTLNQTAQSCRVVATFEVSQRSVYITEAEGLYPEGISLNKIGVIERLLALRVLRPKLEPYISRVELRYD